MIRSIFVAVDGSESSLAAMRFAAGWARNLSASLHAFFVEEEQRYVTYAAISADAGGVAIPVPLDPDKLAAEKLRVAAERATIEKLFHQAVDNQVADARFESKLGATNSILIQCARGADLVVMGKRGRFEVRKSSAPGPTTETVIHDALRPVVVVPEKARVDGPLLIAFDDSKGAQRMLPFAVELAERLGSKIVVLTVHNKRDQAEQIQSSIKSYLQGHKVESKFLIMEGQPAPAILRIAEEERAGLIAMGAFGRNPVFELFFGSVTLSVLERAASPVLLMA